MKEFKGTPSPWVRRKSSPKIIISGSVFNASEGYLIGSVCGNDNSGFYANEDEAEANATLICAAPELLIQLMKVCEAIEESDYWWMDDPSRGGFDLESIKSAIYKALGE